MKPLSGFLPASGTGPPRVDAPAAAQDGCFTLWFAGELFSERPLTPAELLERWVRAPRETLRELDGEFQLAVWDASTSTLTLATDRFASRPLYWARSAAGFAFAERAMPLLATPGVSADPDLDALREAVTFGGYRLADRTHLAAVKMFPGAAWVQVRPGEAPRVERYWHWRDLPPVEPRPLASLIDEAHALWQRALRLRLAGAARPGQTLSGGLDSRAILAEAYAQGETTGRFAWTAITFGLPGSDDARYAELAAAVAGARWLFHPYYREGWLARRAAFIAETDGLIDLTDLGHLECLPLQREFLDLHLSGYIGDAVAGPTFSGVNTAEEVVACLPYYGTSLSWPYPQALERGRELVVALEGAPARFALFEHKLPQSTNRWTAAYRPYLTVRRPFTDTRLFDFFQGLPHAVRAEGALYERFLARCYPDFFRRIPNQKTGLPILTPTWRWQAERARRFAWRKIQPSLAALGLPARPRQRAYTHDDAAFRAPGVWEEIAGTILRPGSVSVETFGRPRVQTLLDDFRERGAAPAQVIGSLYVAEVYHRDRGL